MRHSAILGAAAVLLLAQLPAMAEEITEYTIKQSEPSPGTNFRRDIVKAGTVPLDKSYAELTPAQQAALKAQYEHMADNDEPPYPEHGMRPLYQALAKVHEQLNLQYKGELTMYVTVDDKGQAKAVAVGKSPDPEVTQNVAQFLMLEKFKPALCHGAPCTQVFPFHAELVGPDTRRVENGKPSGPIMVKPNI